MAPQTEKLEDDVDNAAVPGREADKSLGAPPMTRTAAALDFAQAAVKMKRRRVNKTAVYRELGLLQRAAGSSKDHDLLRRRDGDTAKEGGRGGGKAEARVQRGYEGSEKEAKAGCVRGEEGGAYGCL